MENKTLEETLYFLLRPYDWNFYEDVSKTRNATPEYKALEETKEAYEEAAEATPEYKDAEKAAEAWEKVYEPYWNAKEAMWATLEYEEFEKVCEKMRKELRGY